MIGSAVKSLLAISAASAIRVDMVEGKKRVWNVESDNE